MIEMTKCIPVMETIIERGPVENAFGKDIVADEIEKTTTRTALSLMIG